MKGRVLQKLTPWIWECWSSSVAFIIWNQGRIHFRCCLINRDSISVWVCSRDLATLSSNSWTVWSDSSLETGSVIQTREGTLRFVLTQKWSKEIPKPPVSFFSFLLSLWNSVSFVRALSFSSSWMSFTIFSSRLRCWPKAASLSLKACAERNQCWKSWRERSRRSKTFSLAPLSSSSKTSLSFCCLLSKIKLDPGKSVNRSYQTTNNK